MPGFFEAMRIPLLRGRLLRRATSAQGAPPVIVINEEMARRFWPGQDPVGKRLKYGLDPAAKNPWKTVVGMVADMRRQRLDEPAIPYMFQPGINPADGHRRQDQQRSGRTARAIRAEMRALDPAVPPYGIVTVEQRLGRTVALRRSDAAAAALAAVALVLAVIGAYGVIHQSVAARTQEIGVRMALGANAGDRARDGARHWTGPAVVGLGLGLIGSVALSRPCRRSCTRQARSIRSTYLAVTILMFVVTTAATLTPARRAARIDPMAALRDR